MKASVERHNTLSVNARNQTPSSILHAVEIEDIPVKTFHTIFCPVYVLDRKAQGIVGPGPPKWGPRSCIGVYLGRSPFHNGNVALVFSPSTVLVFPQFHVVFDGTFSNVPYMNSGTNPPNWADLLIHYSELSTDKYFELAQNWISNLPLMVPESERSRTQSSIASPIPSLLFLIRHLLRKKTNSPFPSSVLTGTERADPRNSTSSFPTCSSSA